MSLKPKNWLVIVEGTSGDDPDRVYVKLRHVVSSLDEMTAIAKIGYRLGKKMSALEIISVTVREA